MVLSEGRPPEGTRQVSRKESSQTVANDANQEPVHIGDIADPSEKRFEGSVVITDLDEFRRLDLQPGACRACAISRTLDSKEPSITVDRGREVWLALVRTRTQAVVASRKGSGGERGNVRLGVAVAEVITRSAAAITRTKAICPAESNRNGNGI
jgi:hypothetical protein